MDAVLPMGASRPPLKKVRARIFQFPRFEQGAIFHSTISKDLREECMRTATFVANCGRIGHSRASGGPSPFRDQIREIWIGLLMSRERRTDGEEQRVASFIAPSPSMKRVRQTRRFGICMRFYHRVHRHIFLDDHQAACPVNMSWPCATQSQRLSIHGGGTDLAIFVWFERHRQAKSRMLRSVSDERWMSQRRVTHIRTRARKLWNLPTIDLQSRRE